MNSRKLPGSCRIGKCCNSKFSRTAVRWCTNICDSKHSICKSDDSKHSMLWHLWQQSKKSQYTCPKNMTGSFQNGRTSSKMWGPAFNIVSLPKIACKIGRSSLISGKDGKFQNSQSRLEKRDQIKGILVLVSMPESENNKSRSRLDAQDWRKFFLGLVSKPESKCQEFSVSSR